jgi:uncharacterized membrane protein YsdA (DUF1294 family)
MQILIVGYLVEMNANPSSFSQVLARTFLFTLFVEGSTKETETSCAKMYVSNKQFYTAIAMILIVIVYLLLLVIQQRISLLYTEIQRLSQWIIACSIVSCLLFGMDKVLSKMNSKKRRIPEFTLLVTCVIGGAIGSFCGMLLFAHKTRKLKFYIIVLPSIACHYYFMYGGDSNLLYYLVMNNDSSSSTVTSV